MSSASRAICNAVTCAESRHGAAPARLEDETRARMRENVYGFDTRTRALQTGRVDPGSPAESTQGLLLCWRSGSAADGRDAGILALEVEEGSALHVVLTADRGRVDPGSRARGRVVLESTQGLVLASVARSGLHFCSTSAANALRSAPLDPGPSRPSRPRVSCSLGLRHRTGSRPARGRLKCPRDLDGQEDPG